MRPDAPRRPRLADAGPDHARRLHPDKGQVLSLPAWLGLLVGAVASLAIGLRDAAVFTHDGPQRPSALTAPAAIPLPAAAPQPDVLPLPAARVPAPAPAGPLPLASPAGPLPPPAVHAAPAPQPLPDPAGEEN